MAIIDTVATALDQRAPTASFDLKKEDAKEVKKYKPGQMVKITIVGKVESMSFRKPDDPDQTGYEGHISIGMTKLAIGLSERNAMEELLDDDE